MGEERKERSTRTWRRRVATRWPAAERVGDLREAGMRVEADLTEEWNE
jgi:hypothetical protein